MNELHALIEQGRAQVLADLEAQAADRQAEEERMEAEDAAFWRLVHSNLPAAVHPLIVECDMAGWRNMYDIEVTLKGANLAPMLAKFLYPGNNEADFGLDHYLVRTANTDGDGRPDWSGWTAYADLTEALGVASLRAEKLAEMQAAWDAEHPAKPEPAQEPAKLPDAADWLDNAETHYGNWNDQHATAAALIAIAKLLQDNMELTARQMF